MHRNIQLEILRLFCCYILLDISNLIAVQNLFKFELSINKNQRLCTTLVAMPREAHTR